MQDLALSPNPSPRLVSIDVLRGLTMVTLVVQGEVALLDGIPAWAKHAQVSDTMTFIDVIFSVFLFVVGMSIPLALDRRRMAGASSGQLWRHVLLRTLWLLIIGIGLGNMRSGRWGIVPIGLSGSLWSVLLIVSFILVWNRYPACRGRLRKLPLVLRSLGIVLLVYLAAIYREKSGEQIHWLVCRFYIIGIIGWAYLIACSIYLLFRKQLAAVVGCLALLILIYIGDRGGLFDRFQIFIGPDEHTQIGSLWGSWPAMTVAGLFIGILLGKNSPASTPKAFALWTLLFAAGLFFAGFLLRPLYGAFKGAATPSWSLYSAAIACLIYLVLYYVIEIWNMRRWTKGIIPFGENPLLPYFLNFGIHPLLVVLHVESITSRFDSGMAGGVRVIIYSAIVLGLAAWLTRRCYVRIGL